jgi:hypothetical protein
MVKCLLSTATKSRIEGVRGRLRAKGFHSAAPKSKQCSDITPRKVGSAASLLCES